MVHVTERLSTTARVAPSPTPNVIPVTPQAHIYKLEAAEQLPVLNLRLTISWFLCTPEQNLRFLRWNKRQFRTLSHLHRIGAFVGFVALVIPRPYGLYLTFPSLLCCLPAICCSYAMLSIDMVRILFEQYDFWFFTAINLLTWTLLTWLVWDVRVLLLVIGALTLQLTMFLDANFRTFVPAVKSCAIAIPVILVLSILVAMKRLDAPPEAYAKTFQISRLQLQLVDLVLNTSVTLVLFLIRKTYTKRKLLQRRNAQTRVVGCVIYHAKLQLRAMTMASHHSEQSTNDRPSAYETHVLQKQLGITAHKLYPALKTGRPAHYRQQLTLVSLRLSTIDTRRTLWLRWCQHSVGNLLIVVQVLLYVLGATGLFCTAGSLLLPSVASTNNDSEANMWSQRALLAIPFSGFAATTVFVTIFVLSSQIDILRALLRNFNFLFPSLQCTLASLCLADTMRWDYRVWAIAAFWLWFHWILVLDAVTPPVRILLGFHKSMVIPVVVGIWFGIASVAVALFVDSPILSDRVLLRWCVAGHHTITLGTKTLLLNRLLTIFLWLLRLMYQLSTAGEGQLVLIRGIVDYFCPFDTFAGVKSLGPSKRTGLVESDTSLVLPLESSFCRIPSIKRLLSRRASKVTPPRRSSSVGKMPSHRSIALLMTDNHSSRAITEALRVAPSIPNEATLSSRTMAFKTLNELTPPESLDEVRTPIKVLRRCASACE